MGLTLSKMCHPIPRKGSDEGKRLGFITDKSSGLLTPVRVTPHCLGSYCKDQNTNSKNCHVYIRISYRGVDHVAVE